jgi:transposase, IS5 family
VVPWSKLCALIEPVYLKAGNGRPPVRVERMLRIYFLQRWLNLSDPAAEEALYDSVAMRGFVGIDPGREPVPDETTVCRFRHLLETYNRGRQLFAEVRLSSLEQDPGIIARKSVIHRRTATLRPHSTAARRQHVLTLG